MSSEEKNLRIELNTSLATVRTLDEAVKRGEIKRNAILSALNYHSARQITLEQLIETERRNSTWASNG